MKNIFSNLRNILCSDKDSVWYSTIAIMVLLVFGQSLSFSFLSWDDTFHICQNPNFQSADGSFLNFWKSDFLGLYAPLTYTIWAGLISFAKLIFGENSNCGEWSGLFHGLNLLIHLLNTILVYEVLKHLVKVENRKYAAFGAILFAIHPLQVEAAVWISASRDLVSFLFGICGVLFALKDRWRQATVFVLVSCLAKATGVVFPLIIFAILIQKRKYSEVTKYLPAFVGAIGFGIFAKFLQPDTALNFVSPIWQRPFIFGHNLGFYFSKLILPINLAPDYTRSIQSLNQDPSLFWPLGIFLAAASGLYFLKRSQGLLALMLITISVLPVSGLIPFGFEETSTVADRYFYPAMFGVALFAANLLSTYQNKKLNTAALALLMVFSILSFRQVRYWENDETLFDYNLSVFPNSTVSLQIKADRYFAKGDYQRSLDELQKVLELRSPNVMIIIKTSLSLENLGRLDEAEKLYNFALEKNIKSTDIYNNLGKIHYLKGQPQLAEKLWMTATQENPLNFQPQYNLGQLYLIQGKFQESLDAFLKAKNIIPQHPRIDEKIREVRSKIR
ncbi:tetratricopeptide repeat protein [Bdellovibrio sp. HCB337]|uniref:tetratricopeptide repeat protein n=1 Tax=Bdellovibrio sp. HCB337 TaxID=3394358 RepID=UPI0039A5B2B8